MAQALCAVQLSLANGLISPLSLSNGEDCSLYTAGKKRFKRKRATNEVKRLVCPFSYVKAQASGNFPSPKELASLNEDILREHCNLGYRASHILQFARKVENGKLDEICKCVLPEKFYGELMKIKGFGPFACANIMMCIGVYHKIPEDTETIRHLKEVHSRENCSKRTVGAIIEQVYMKYAPFQCLAYWSELLDYYENKFGKLSELSNSSYGTVTGSRIYMDRSN